MKQKKAVVFRGGGQYFFWQQGVSKYLQNNIDLSDTIYIAASSGALTAVLLVCQICPETALECAIGLCDKHNIWDRSLGLLGKWGRIIEKWLDDILPENAAQLCNDKVFILVSRFLAPKKIVSNFSTRKELIDCLMTTIHIPFFMDYYPFRWFDGWLCYDGDIDIFTDETYKIFDNKHQYLFVYYKNDTHLQTNPIKMIRTNNKHYFKNFIQYGFDYAKKLFGPRNSMLKQKIF